LIAERRLLLWLLLQPSETCIDLGFAGMNRGAAHADFLCQWYPNELGAQSDELGASQPGQRQAQRAQHDGARWIAVQDEQMGQDRESHGDCQPQRAGPGETGAQQGPGKAARFGHRHEGVQIDKVLARH
jgi:hypothetical protein